MRNPKYVGLWAWGRATNVLNPITGRVRQEECPPEDALQFTRERPDLRIVDDDLFLKAQGLLDGMVLEQVGDLRQIADDA